MFKTCRQKHVPLINKRMSPGLAHQLLCLFACDWLLHWSDDRSPIGCQSMLPSRIVTWSMECMKRNWHSLKIAWLNLAQTNIMSDSAVTVSIRVMTRGGHKVAQAESGVHSQFWWVHQWEFTLLELHQEGQRWARTSTDESGLHSQGWCPDQQITICTCVCAQTQVHVAWTGTYTWNRRAELMKKLRNPPAIATIAKRSRQIMYKMLVYHRSLLNMPFWTLNVCAQLGNPSDTQSWRIAD